MHSEYMLVNTLDTIPDDSTSIPDVLYEIYANIKRRCLFEFPLETDHIEVARFKRLIMLSLNTLLEMKTLADVVYFDPDIYDDIERGYWSWIENFINYSFNLPDDVNPFLWMIEYAKTTEVSYIIEKLYGHPLNIEDLFKLNQEQYYFHDCCGITLPLEPGHTSTTFMSSRLSSMEFIRKEILASITLTTTGSQLLPETEEGDEY